MAPTRELVLQIAGQVAKYCAPLGCRAVAVYGGTPKWEQAVELEAGCELVVATLGRLLDFLGIYGSGGQGSPGHLRDGGGDAKGWAAADVTIHGDVVGSH